MGKRRADLDGDLHCLSCGEPSLRFDDLAKVFAVNIFHDDKGRLAVRPNIINRDNVWMGKAGGCLSFPVESADKLIIVGILLPQDLHCNQPVQQSILGAVDQCHAAVADFLHYFISVRKNAADHETNLSL